MKVFKCDEGRLTDLSEKQNDWLSLTQQGEVLNFQSVLKKLGYYSKIKDLTLSVIQGEVSTRLADRVKIEGFEKLHLFLNGEQIERVNEKLTQAVKPIVSRLVKSFVRDILGYSSNLYIDSLPVVRFFVPHDIYIENQSRFSKWPGYLKIQGPHHDTWFDHATAGLNMWMAMGRVSKGNGLLIYPEVWGKTIAHDGHRQMPKSQYLGRPRNFELGRGDLLFFHGEHLHASELNVTTETRYVLTTRFVLKRPKFKEVQQWHPWAASDLVNTKHERFATWHSYFSLGWLKHFLWAVTRKIQKLMGVRSIKEGSHKRHYEEGSKRRSNDMERPFEVTGLQNHELKAISNKVCVLKKEDKLFAFSRYCPHEGADLSKGYYAGGKIFCPWHGLCFDPEKGTQPCSKIKNLTTYPLEQTSSQIYRMK